MLTNNPFKETTVESVTAQMQDLNVKAGQKAMYTTAEGFMKNTKPANAVLDKKAKISRISENTDEDGHITDDSSTEGSANIP
jgi:hypothetical protein